MHALVCSAFCVHPSGLPPCFEDGLFKGSGTHRASFFFWILYLTPLCCLAVAP